MADNPDNTNSRFTAQAPDVEDRLKADTVGLVTLNDFRKRRAEALEAAQDVSASGAVSTTASGATTPDVREPVAKSAFKKRKKIVKKGALSFGDDEEEEQGGDASFSPTTQSMPPNASAPATDSEAVSDASTAPFKKRPLRPNATLGHQPKAMTKSALLKEAQLKEALRKEYTQIQEAVKATEFVLPFVFYDGKNQPGGMCRMKKGDHIWLFLERARKVGADKADKGRRDWARISVDDLMLVKGDLIIPQHYEFHHFIINRSVGYLGPLFVYSSEPTSATPKDLLPASDASDSAASEAADSANHLMTAAQRKQQAAAIVGSDDSELEGFEDDPNMTKVVDRRWYERNKHIYPASTWEEYDATRDYSTGVRKDKDGNNMFFSRSR
ncbi:unnamed protein product [Zymoseptoria tritici ST99CH_3D1]|nr:unnamed protein product [Zymoseptoria tritici ST99CH_3D1]